MRHFRTAASLANFCQLLFFATIKSSSSRISLLQVERRTKAGFFVLAHREYNEKHKQKRDM